MLATSGLPRAELWRAHGAAEAFMAEIGAFVDVIAAGEPPEVGFEDGRQALILAEAAIKSAAEGRTVKTSEIR